MGNSNQPNRMWSREDPGKPTMKQVGESSSHNEKHRVVNVADTLTRLYRPDPPEEVEVDIIFFHGLELENESPVHLSTWKSGDGTQELWPQVWLSQNYSKAQITVASYDTSIHTTPTRGRTDLYLIRENLFQDIERELGGHFPVILVGHSFGGLVIKEFCLQAHKKKKANDVNPFIDRIRGIFFYATPHLGMNDGIFHQLVEESRSANKPLLSCVDALSTYAARLHHEFSDIQKMYSWKIYGLMETIAVGGARDVLVSEASSRFGDVFAAADGCDHFSICKPMSKECTSYQYLVRLIDSVCEKWKKRERKRSKMDTVGMDCLVQDTVVRLRLNVYLGLWGMGGVGKTTLAKRVFEEIAEEFEYTCFVENFKGISGDREEVKKKVWTKMQHHGRPIPKTEVGWCEVVGKRLLVVLDDIGSDEHIFFLKGIIDNNDMEHSRFIVTSRDRELLSRLDGCRYISTYLQEVEILGHGDAMQLFLNCALLTNEEPAEWMKDITEEIVRGCSGLPLTLEVIGRHLRSVRNERVWKELPKALREAEKIPFLEEQVWAKLRVSYDTLQEEEKNVFLDLACFFWTFRFTHDRIVYILSSRCSSVSNILQSLMDKSFVKMGKQIKDDRTEFVFQIHEHLRSMGRKIVQDQGIIYLSFDTPEEDLRPILSDRSLYEKIVGFQCSKRCPSYPEPCPGGHLCVSRDGQLCVPSMIQRALPHMSSLMYLSLELDRYRPSIGGLSLPPNIVCAWLREDTWHSNLNVGLQPLAKLTYLRWFRGDPSSTLSATACASLGALKFLGLRCSPVLQSGDYLPIAFENLRNLEVLYIYRRCGDEDFTNFLSRDETFLRVNRDRIRFVMSGARLTDNEELPNTIGQLSRLRTLVLHNLMCEALPNTIGDLKELVRLEIRECKYLRELPEIFGGLSKLKYLEMVNLWRLRHLPESIGNLRSLEQLMIEDVELVDLPETFGMLSELKHLSLWCGSLQKLPGTFRNLIELQHWELHWGNRDNVSNEILSFLIDCSTRFSDHPLSRERFPPTSPRIGKLSRLKTLVFGHYPRGSDPHKQFSDELIRLEEVRLCECYTPCLEKIRRVYFSSSGSPRCTVTIHRCYRSPSKRIHAA